MLALQTSGRRQTVYVSFMSNSHSCRVPAPLLEDTGAPPSGANGRKVRFRPSEGHKTPFQPFPNAPLTGS